MRITVIGSGGTGGYFGAKLARAGHDVTFVARGAHLQAMRERGLTIRSAVEGEWRVDAVAVDALAGAPEADLVLFCVKSYDTEEAGALARAVTGPGTLVLSIQNGIDNEDKLSRILGPGCVAGGAAYIIANIAGPGVIAHHQFGRIVMGEMSGGLSDRVQRVADTLREAGIEAEADPDVRRTLWRKYVFLVAFSGTTTVTRLPVGFVRGVPETRSLWRSQVEELLELARADGSALGDDALAQCTSLLESLGDGNYSSMYHDLAAGKRLELDSLHGHAVRLGERYGIAVPTLRAVYGALMPYLAGKPRAGVNAPADPA